MSDFLVVVECVVPMMWRAKGHFLAIEFHLEMFLLGLFGGTAESLEHLHNVAPVNVVSGRMCEELLEGVLSVLHDFDCMRCGTAMVPVVPSLVLFKLGASGLVGYRIW